MSYLKIQKNFGIHGTNEQYNINLKLESKKMYDYSLEHVKSTSILTFTTDAKLSSSIIISELSLATSVP